MEAYSLAEGPIYQIHFLKYHKDLVAVIFQLFHDHLRNPIRHCHRLQPRMHTLGECYV